MQEVTDPNLLAYLNNQQTPAQQPVLPQNAPMITAARPDAQLRSTQVSTQNSLNADARAASAAAREAQKFPFELEKIQSDIDKVKREQEAYKDTQGVKPTESEQQAAGQAVSLSVGLNQIKKLGIPDKSLLVPSWPEEIVRQATGDYKPVVGLTQSDKRRAVSTAYDSLVDPVIWLSTGAAANTEQAARLKSAITPVPGDGPETLKTKLATLVGYIEQAKARAGVASPKVLQALEEAQKTAPVLYGSGPVDASTNVEDLIQGSTGSFNTPQQGDVNLSKQTYTKDVPEDMQQEYSAFLQNTPRGSLTLDAYNKMRQELDKKYNYPLKNYADEEGQNLVNAFNRGATINRIPGVEQPMSGVGQAAAELMQAPVIGPALASYTNAALAGAPEFFGGDSAKTAFDVSGRDNPIGNLIGEIVGGTIPVVKGVAALEKLGAGKLAAELMANIGYSQVRGQAGLDDRATGEDRLRQLGWDTAIGGGATLGGNAFVKGARGYQNEETKAALEKLAPEEFTSFSNRAPLPADAITPPGFQSLSDDELLQESFKAEQGLKAWRDYNLLQGQTVKARDDIKQEIAKLAEANKQEIENRITNIPYFNLKNREQQQIIRRELEKKFPTDTTLIAESPEFASRLQQLTDIEAPKGLSPEQLIERQKRIDEYLRVDPSVEKLSTPPIDATTLQRVGLGNKEEAFQGIGFVGSARRKAEESWSLQNSGRVLSIIGKELPKGLKAGQEANAYVNEQLNNFYNSIKPQLKGRVDEPFATALSAIQKQVGTDPEKLRLWAYIQEALTKFAPKGQFNGESYKDFQQRLRQFKDVWSEVSDGRSSIEAQDMVRIADKVGTQVRALASRANPTIGRRLKLADQAWARQMRIERASRYSAALGNNGVASPKEYLQAIAALDTSKGKSAISRGEGLDQDYANAALKVLGGTVASKANPWLTSAVFLGPLGTGYAAPGLTSAAIAAGGALYTPGFKRGTQAVLDGKIGKTGETIAETLKKKYGNKFAQKVINNLSEDSLTAYTTQALRAKMQGR